MATASTHDFFVGSASVAGALIGLLFVAISVAPERILGPEASEAHSLRAAAALTSFTNALTVSLFGLVPGLNVGGAATAVAGVGLLFVGGALVGIVPAWRAKRVELKDISFLIGLLALFVIQLITAIELDQRAGDSNELQRICILVIVCFLIGIARSWELVGGPSVRLSRQLLDHAQSRHAAQEPEDAGEQ